MFERFFLFDTTTDKYSHVSIVVERKKTLSDLRLVTFLLYHHNFKKSVGLNGKL